MSRTYSILCEDCKESLWVAQGWPSMPESKSFYFNNKELMLTLKDFLFRHENHRLVFIDDEKIDDDVEELDCRETLDK